MKKDQYKELHERVLDLKKDIDSIEKLLKFNDEETVDSDDFKDNVSQRTTKESVLEKENKEIEPPKYDLSLIGLILGICSWLFYSFGFLTMVAVGLNIYWLVGYYKHHGKYSPMLVIGLITAIFGFLLYFAEFTQTTY